MKLAAIYNAIIVQPFELEEAQFGNIIVPDIGSEKNKICKVVDVGPGSYVPGVGWVETVLQVGDLVILPTMGFTRFDFKGDEYFIGPENQILGRIITDDVSTEANP
jgi:co-chaperonin GroES (HSP10)